MGDGDGCQMGATITFVGLWMDGLPGRSSRPDVRGVGKVRLRLRLRRDKLWPQPAAEAIIWCAARDSTSARDGGSSSLPKR